MPPVSPARRRSPLNPIVIGFIGLPTALAFSRAGHIVYGQTRSSSSTAELAKDEIIPVVFDPSTSEGIKAFVELAKSVDTGEPPP